MNYITYFYSGYCNVLLQHFFIMNDIMHLYSGYFSVFLQRLWLLEDNSAAAGLNVPLFSHLWIWFVNGCNEDRYQERVRSGEREKQIIRRKDRHTDRQTEKFTNDGDLYSTFHPCVFEIDLTIKFFCVCVCVCVCVCGKLDLTNNQRQVVLFLLTSTTPNSTGFQGQTVSDRL
jgi:hypothetical protein